MKRCKHCGKPLEGFMHADTKLIRCTQTKTRQYGYSADPVGSPCNISCIMYGKDEEQ